MRYLVVSVGTFYILLPYFTLENRTLVQGGTKVNVGFHYTQPTWFLNSVVGFLNSVVGKIPQLRGGKKPTPYFRVVFFHFEGVQLGVSKNNGTPRWMVYKGKPY